jgi:hypothetical protein
MRLLSEASGAPRMDTLSPFFESETPFLEVRLVLTLIGLEFFERKGV